MKQKKQSKEPFKGIQPDMAPKQIQRHEWINDGTHDICPHCKLLRWKIYGKGYTYSYTMLPCLTEEPACINKPTEAEKFEPQEDYMTWCGYCKIEVMASNLIGNDYGHFICRTCYAKQTPDKEAGKV